VSIQASQIGQEPRNAIGQSLGPPHVELERKNSLRKFFEQWHPWGAGEQPSLFIVQNRGLALHKQDAAKHHQYEAKDPAL
jgi:hypothetical protein